MHGALRNDRRFNVRRRLDAIMDINLPGMSGAEALRE
jgi:CheY-like chemotaxis protein